MTFSPPSPTLLTLIVLLAALTFGPAPGSAQERPRPKTSGSAESEIERYCGNVAPSAAEARIAFQMKHLLELESRISRRLGELEAKESSARDWVAKREAMMKAANEDVVAIYAKMSAEAASSQIGAMEENAAAAILAKLSPKAASLILAEMEAGKAAKLASLMVGVVNDDKKS